ncbi:MAG: protein regulator of cytokinesis family protein [Ignavibacteriales bacterium]|nr:protein regulator of cytokinesis family protein [Ignavibacteriales bacterium]
MKLAAKQVELAAVPVRQRRIQNATGRIRRPAHPPGHAQSRRHRSQGRQRSRACSATKRPSTTSPACSCASKPATPTLPRRSQQSTPTRSTTSAWISPWTALQSKRMTPQI